MWSTPSLPLLPGALLLRVVISVRVPSTGQTELFNLLKLSVYKQLNNV